MGESTKIEWTDHTLNVWHGCHKVSDGCKHCYAEVSTPVRVKRARGLQLWGADAWRSETKSWAQDLWRWNRAAQTDGARKLVFAQSLSDTFEDRSDTTTRLCVIDASGEYATLDELRAEFFDVVSECTSLTFQLLTKRPENVLWMVPASWREHWPEHVWIGATVESQQMAEQRIPHLLRIPAPVRFLSMEPLLGPVDLCDLVRHEEVGEHHYSALECDVDAEDEADWGGRSVSWVIVGGESGPKARPFDLAWARSIVAQCRAAHVPVFVKQLGSRPHSAIAADYWHGDSRKDGSILLFDPKGGDPAEWPEDLRVREMPEVSNASQ